MSLRGYEDHPFRTDLRPTGAVLLLQLLVIFSSFSWTRSTPPDSHLHLLVACFSRLELTRGPAGDALQQHSLEDVSPTQPGSILSARLGGGFTNE